MIRAATTDSGYGQEAKREWRDSFWWNITRMLGRTRRSQRTVFMLESLDGAEIEKALKLGFAEQNLHVCNKNAAVAATLRRRYRSINTYGVDADVAFRRIASSGTTIDVCSLDFCGTLTPAMMSTITLAAACTNYVAGVNVLGGRESHDGFSFIQEVANHFSMMKIRHGGRVASIAVACCRGAAIRKLMSVIATAEYGDSIDKRERLIATTTRDLLSECIVDSGSYTSRRSPMAWAVIDLRGARR